ncbi:macrolide phosphotransferase k [Thozetella sp. PMI_491]|nr:macrolide phosphotransferase k [Thozetella sp. PMI_491]
MDGLDSHSPAEPKTGEDLGADRKTKFKPTWQFWIVLASLAFCGLLSSLEGTIITNALPTIVAELGGGSDYTWIANAFFLSSVATTPLYGQASDVLGRRWLTIGAVAIFTVGSGISGGATGMGMLIAGRTVQGLGGGGINLLIEMIIADLVPLRERGTYMAVVLIAVVVGASVGPLIGGVIVTYTTWRWVFYLNLPLGGVALVLLVAFLHTNYQRGQSAKSRLARIDFVGNMIFILANAALLIALSGGGVIHPWNSYQIIVPLVLGFLGIALFTAFEWTPSVCPEPSFPRAIVSNRTSAAALVLTFLHAVAMYQTIYFLPVYFQSVLATSPSRSGVLTLPLFVTTVPFGMIGGLMLSKLGRYKPIHLLGFALIVVSYGLFSILDKSSSTAAYVCIQLVGALGMGMVVPTLLPAVQASLPESLVATSTGVWSFARGFAALFAVTIPSAVFNNECAARATAISDPHIAGLFISGGGYEHATGAFVNAITDGTVRGEVIGVFEGAMRIVWLVGIVFGALGFLIVFLEKEVPLREELDTEFGLKEKIKDPAALSEEEKGASGSASTNL